MKGVDDLRILPCVLSPFSVKREVDNPALGRRDSFFAGRIELGPGYVIYIKTASEEEGGNL